MGRADISVTPNNQIMKRRNISLPKLRTGDEIHRLPKSSGISGLTSSKSVRLGSFQEIKGFVTSAGPYITPEDIRRVEYRESKRRWIQPRSFYCSVKTRPHFISNYVQATPSQVPLLHSYREIEKNKWLAGDFRPTRNIHFRI